jgi:hypothetical protein
MRRIFLLVALFASSACFALQERACPFVAAGTALRLDIEGLTDRAEAVLEGRIVSKTVLQVGPKRIETEYVVRVERDLLGASSSVFNFRLPGGTLADGRGMVIAGMPELLVDEEVLLFLTGESAAGIRMPVGLAQGKFRVLRDAQGTKRLTRAGGPLELVAPNGTLQTLAPSALEYAATLQQIETALATRAERRPAQGARLQGEKL